MNPAVPFSSSMNTKIITLSKSNKLALLGRLLERVKGRHAEAEALLSRLRQLSPKLAAQFSLKETALGILTLRMIVPADFEALSDTDTKVPSYLAISYCWHNPGWKAVEAAKPVTEWGMSLPMVNKILECRNSKEEGIWIDAVCIDQKNEEEKAIAIGSMDYIYRSCRRLVIVLEDVQLTQVEENMGTKYADKYETMCVVVRERKLEGLEKTDYIESTWKFDEPDIEDLEAFTMKMLGSRWYSRAWCAHEVSVNEHNKHTSPLFLCFSADGRVLSFEFRTLFWFAASLNMLHRNKANGNLPASSEDPALLSDPTAPTLFHRMARVNQLYSSGQDLATGRDSEFSMLSHVTSVSSLGCQELGDLAVIAMNTAGLPLVFTGSIQSRGEIAYMSSVIALASGDINPLFSYGTVLRMPDSKDGMFVSWAPQAYNSVKQLRVKTPFPESINHTTREYIELDLLLIKGKPLRISPEAITKALSIIEKCNLKEDEPRVEAELVSIDQHHVKTAVNLMNTASVSYRWMESLLASALECGLDWMKRFPDTLNPKPWSENWSYGIFASFKSEYTDAAKHLLSYFDISEENTTHFKSEHLDPVIRFLTCITDDRLRLVLKVPRRIQTSVSGGFAITNRTSNRCWFAVPLAAAHLPFHQTKAWLVEPHDPANPLPPEHERYVPRSAGNIPTDLDSYVDSIPLLDSDFPDRRVQPNNLSSWQLRGKQCFVGSSAIVADGDAVVLLKNQKVYGGEPHDWAAMLQKLYPAGERFQAVLPILSSQLDVMSLKSGKDASQGETTQA